MKIKIFMAVGTGVAIGITSEQGKLPITTRILTDKVNKKYLPASPKR
jgi:hypothetical protein